MSDARGLDATSRPRAHDSWWIAILGEGRHLPAEAAGLTGQSPPQLVFPDQPNGRSLWILRGRELTAPATASNALCGAVFDGVIFNRTDLRSQLGATAEPEDNDASLALRAYMHWGPAFLPRIKGIFALIIWDTKREGLLCARDPLGVYPLFYAESDGRIALATSIDSLVGHADVPRTVNRAALAESLYHHPSGEAETLYASVRRVPMSNVLRIDRTGKHVDRYWDPLPAGTPVDWLREDELEQFDALLSRTIGNYLQLGPAGIYLSGGLDSVSVAAVAIDDCRQHGLPVPLALSMVFPHPETNEETVQRSVASGLGLPQVLMPFDEAVGQRGWFRATLELAAESPAPLLSPWRPAYDHLAQEAVRRDRRIILTGGGGDEWLTVDPHYAADLLRSLDIRALYRFWNDAWGSYNLSPLSMLKSLVWSFGVRPLIGAIAGAAVFQVAPNVLRMRRLRRLEGLAPDWLAPDPSLRHELHQRAERFVEHGLAKPALSDFYLREIRRALRLPLFSIEMEEIFDSGRRSGVQILQPYWDPDLIALLCRTPPALLNKGGRNKALVRQTLARRFPNIGFERHKKVLAINFLRGLINREGMPAWRECGGARDLADLGVVDAAALQQAAEQDLPGQSLLRAYTIWEVLNAESWLRGHL